jgi:hypothetical protein
MNALLTPRVRRHWFFLVAPLVLAADVYVAFRERGEIDRFIEAGLLLDLAVLIPCLYWFCYRGRGRKAAIQAAALCCLGIWAALKLVPEAQHRLLDYVAPLRYLGIAVLVWLELAVVVAIYRTAFKGGSAEEVAAQAQERADLPPWAARILAREALFWRSAWRWLKGLLGGK